MQRNNSPRYFLFGRGELNGWSKKTDTELATRVPFIIRVPWASASIGKSTPVKAELIDMYKASHARSCPPRFSL